MANIGGIMRKVILLCFLAVLFCLIQTAFTQTLIDAGAWTEFYGYKVPQQDDPRIRSLQGLRFRVKNALTPGFGFFFRGRAASDLSNKLSSDPDFRVFGAYAEYVRRDKVTVRVGRQFVSTGLAGFTVDGGRLDFSLFNTFRLSGYAGGVPGPTFYSLEKIASWDDRNAYGGRLEYSGVKDIRTGISFLQRNANSRVDSRAGGIDLNIRSGPFYENARLDYDFFFRRVKVGVMRSGFEFQRGHRIEFEYMYRQPSFELSNLLSVFRAEPFHQVRVAPVYRIGRDVYAHGSLSYTIFEDDYNTRLTAGASYRGHSAGLIFSNGFGGTRLGVFGNLFRNFGRKIRGYVNANMYNYKLDTNEDDVTPSVSAAFGALANLTRGLNSRVELQLLSNRDFEYDTRFYIRLGYDFNSRFQSGAASAGGDDSNPRGGQGR
jgi:hypothetical protein